MLKYSFRTTEMETRERKQGIRIIEGAGVFLFSASILRFDALLIGRGGWYGALMGLSAMPFAYYLADLFSGLVHWVCDSFGSSTTPLWGPMLVKPFRDHHRDPLQITRISLVENLGASAIAGTLVFWLSFPLLFPVQRTGGPWLFGYWLWSYFLVFSVLSNLLHRWSHFPATKKPRWMVALQRVHLILNHEAHGVHHRKPHRKNYCISCGWANGLTNNIPWGTIEKGLSYVGITTNFD